jgi:voltage-gated sodium channel
MDLVIISISVVEVVGTLAFESDSYGLSAFRLLRVFRVFRVLSFFERLNMLVKAFVYAMADIVWVAVLIVILLYVFAILANGFFANSTSLDAAGFNSNQHFGSVLQAMTTLFQLMTLDAWMSGITRPVGQVYPAAFPFLIFFVTLGALGCADHMHGCYGNCLSD